ncbi:hypothetical protein L6654_06865 [Bradyrhizobium sp. WYCCWR 13023]|uniref:Uncharacterized protein n=1 Tax=Bradyrhizobium zhengyangense TaxID=2911009 RepID=A0A9X1R4Y2_9BRAD|nr:MULTISPECIES: hypothetical protein [Bradyrhizobium]MCG2626344.1 hypothetical protein [Bradyrhizobium zhengyangense]MCG2665955.1 hypothetical protein [Bradyrhizobium zhengyangense]MDA9522239.1 hypothetical protein [Bradyrhizobium sp. CCBAU 11434]
MEQPKSTTNDQSGISSTTSAPPTWMHRTAAYSPDRRAKMLEHMARARSTPQHQPAAAPMSAQKSGLDILGDLFGYVVLFGAIAILCMSRIPLYLGAFLFLADDERIEGAFAAVGVRFEPDTVGPDLIKGFASWIGWIALLACLRTSAPVWLAPLLPPSQSWTYIAGMALALSVVEALGSLAMRRARLRLGWEIGVDSLTFTTIKFVIAIGALLLVVLLGTV